MNMPSFELVVARYAEDLNWLRNIPDNIRQTVYDKHPQTPHPNAHRLPNVGREAHTYLTHIATRYDTLSEWTIFCQGKPFDHAYDFKKRLKTLANSVEIPHHFEWLGHVIDSDDAQGERLFKSWSKNQDGRGLDLNGFHRALFQTDGPALYTFALGAQFVVHQSVIRRRSLAFYRHALAISTSFADAAHCYERTWNRLFDEPFALPNGQLTAYLKPIRKQLT